MCVGASLCSQTLGPDPLFSLCSVINPLFWLRFAWSHSLWGLPMRMVSPQRPSLPRVRLSAQASPLATHRRLHRPLAGSTNGAGGGTLVSPPRSVQLPVLAGPPPQDVVQRNRGDIQRSVLPPIDNRPQHRVGGSPLAVVGDIDGSNEHNEGGDYDDYVDDAPSWHHDPLHQGGAGLSDKATGAGPVVPPSSEVTARQPVGFPNIPMTDSPGTGSLDFIEGSRVISLGKRGIKLAARNKGQR